MTMVVMLLSSVINAMHFLVHDLLHRRLLLLWRLILFPPPCRLLLSLSGCPLLPALHKSWHTSSSADKKTESSESSSAEFISSISFDKELIQTSACKEQKNTTKLVQEQRKVVKDPETGGYMSWVNRIYCWCPSLWWCSTWWRGWVAIWSTCVMYLHICRDMMHQCKSSTLMNRISDERRSY